MSRATTLGLLLLAASMPVCTSAQTGIHLALPAEHWSLEAVRRAEALGLVTEYLPAQRTASRNEVGAALRQAAQLAGNGRHSSLAAGWLARFQEEFPETGGRIDPELGSAIGVLGIRREGLSAPGAGYRSDFGDPPTGARPLDDVEEARGYAELAARLAPWLATQARTELDEDGVNTRNWEVAASNGVLAVGAGRGGSSYGYTGFGGITLSGGASLERVQLQTVRPIRMGPVGRAAVHLQVARFDESRHPGDPYFVSVALTLRPHSRLTLAGYRGALFGGDSAGAALTGRTFVQTLFGLTQNLENGFANQVASVEARYRMPTEGVLPVTLYTEWGMEDLDVVRSVRDSPGGLVGVYLPRAPGIDWLSLGVERVVFEHSCCENGIWYRHFQHSGGWASGSVPLGHPLGGHGRETAVYLAAEPGTARLRLHARGFRRFRGEENLYAPELGGRSRGVTGQGAFRISRRLDLSLRGSYEEGGDWLAKAFEAGASIIF